MCNAGAGHGESCPRPRSQQPLKCFPAAIAGAQVVSHHSLPSNIRMNVPHMDECMTNQNPKLYPTIPSSTNCLRFIIRIVEITYRKLKSCTETDRHCVSNRHHLCIFRVHELKCCIFVDDGGFGDSDGFSMCIPYFANMQTRT